MVCSPPALHGWLKVVGALMFLLALDCWLGCGRTIGCCSPEAGPWDAAGLYWTRQFRSAFQACLPGLGMDEACVVVGLVGAALLLLSHAFCSCSERFGRAGRTLWSHVKRGCTVLWRSKLIVVIQPVSPPSTMLMSMDLVRFSSKVQAESRARFQGKCCGEWCGY